MISSTAILSGTPTSTCILHPMPLNDDGLNGLKYSLIARTNDTKGGQRVEVQTISIKY